MLCDYDDRGQLSVEATGFDGNHGVACDTLALSLPRLSKKLRWQPCAGIGFRRWHGGVGFVESPLNDLQLFTGDEHLFDAIMAADIIYSCTCDLLPVLFTTVNRLLKPEGVFWLSFVTRDGPITPRLLVAAASEAGFRIGAPSIA